jgi:hypothetical protein
MQPGFHIILNYRREDTAGHAGRLYDDLADQFGADQVFMDIDAIEPGVDFAEVIEHAVGSASVFLSLIGQRWLSAVDADGMRRLDKADDFVRLEIEAALRPEVRVIPVLVQNATMPTSEDLPASMAPFARRNAIELRDNSWRYDVGRLIETIQQVREGAPTDGSARARPRPAGRATAPRRPGAWTIAAAGIAAVLTIAVVIGLAVSWLSGGGGEPSVSVDSVDAELAKFQPTPTEIAKDVIIATAHVTVRHSVPGTPYKLTFQLESRDSPAGPVSREGATDMPFVVDKRNDQCSCDLRFESFSRGKEYRVRVDIYDESLETAAQLDHEWSNWVQT